MSYTIKVEYKDEITNNQGTCQRSFLDYDEDAEKLGSVIREMLENSKELSKTFMSIQ